MLLASLALALFCAPQAAPPADDGTAKVWDNLDVMRRMLVHQIGAKHDAISVAPGRTDDGEVVTTKDGRVVTVGRGREGGGAGYVVPDNAAEKAADDSVANSYLRLHNANWFESSVASEAEYVPGLAAIFSVTVPVKVRIVTLEAKKDESKKPNETKNADDEAWEKLARGDDDAADRHVKTLLGLAGKGQEEPRRELKFDEAAVKVLKETVADTVARFGSRVGLGHGERIAVVVKLQPGSVVGDGDGKPGEKKSETIADERGVLLDAFGGSGGQSGRTFYSFNGNGIATIVRRFVLQVSADDLRAYKSGDLERDELLRKMRFEEFTMPATANTVFNRFGWSSNLAK